MPEYDYIWLTRLIKESEDRHGEWSRKWTITPVRLETANVNGNAVSASQGDSVSVCSTVATN